MWRSALLLLLVVAAAGLSARSPQPESGISLLRGRVVDARDGAALPRTRVVVSVGERTLAAVLTDDRGAFVTAVPAATATYGVRATKAGFATLGIAVSASDTAGEVVLALVRGAAIVGRVIDPAGEPVVGVAVAARRETNGAAAPTLPVVSDTDDRGEFRLGGLPAGRYAVRVVSVAIPTGPFEAQPDTLRAQTLDAIAKTFGAPPQTGTAVVDVRAAEETAVPALVMSGAPGRSRCTQPVAAPPEDASAGAAIRGRVLAASGAPLPCAHVWATRPGMPARAAATDASGRYTIDALTGGPYLVEARQAGFVSRRYGQQRAQDPGTPVRLRDGQVVGDVDLTLSRGHVITGTVVDEQGEPVAGAIVRALEVRTIDGRPVALTARGAADAPAGWRGERVRGTDDRGRYRLYGLSPGTYLVTASIEGELSGTPQPHGYAPVFHPGTTDPSGAARVVLDIGRDVVSADLVFVAVPTARVAGTVIASDGRPLAGPVRLRVSGRSGALDVNARTTAAAADGAFAFTGVPPGDYVIQAAAREFGMQYVTVVDAEPPPVIIRTTPGATVEGRLTIVGEMVAGTQVGMQALPVDWDRAAGQSTLTPLPDGRFRFAGLQGPRRFVCCTGFEDWYLESVVIEGEVVTDRPFDFGAGGAVYRDAEIVISTRGAVLSGQATIDGDERVGDYAVVVFPVDRAGWVRGSRYLKFVRADRAGGFQVTGLPPGHYHAAAVDVLEGSVAGGEWQDPLVLEQLAARAQRILLSDAERASATLRLIRR